MEPQRDDDALPGSAEPVEGSIGSVCACCGSRRGNRFSPVLWRGLIDEWELSDEEYRYVDRQQGERCIACHSNLRSQALALAIVRACNSRRPFRDFAHSMRGRLLRVLEINAAGDLPFAWRSRRVRRSYPDLDMMDMADVPTGAYDLVVHSDTLEHVPDPVKGLAECRRVLRPGGACCFTVPIVVGRLSRSRRGLPPSYHGEPSGDRTDYLVHTEYGADAWRQVLAAGFVECRVVAVRPPAAHALVGIKGSDR